MPKLVEYNVRDQLYKAIVQIMRTIRAVNGYNSNVTVTNSLEKPTRDGKPYILGVFMGPETPTDDAGISMIQGMSTTIYINGACFIDSTKDVEYEAEGLNGLVQDVRTCITENINLLNAAILLDESGTYIRPNIKIGALETDEGVLRDSGMAEFTQQIIVEYQNGPEW